MAQTVKRLPAIWNTWVRSLGQEDPLEKEVATHSSTFAWKIPWTEEPGRLHGVAKSWTRLSDFTSLLFPGASLMAQWYRTHLLMQETWIQTLGGEDPLEKEVATHSKVLAWEIPWTEEPGGLRSMRSQRIGHD